MVKTPSDGVVEVGVVFVDVDVVVDDGWVEVVEDPEAWVVEVEPCGALAVPPHDAVIMARTPRRASDVCLPLVTCAPHLLRNSSSGETSRE